MNTERIVANFKHYILTSFEFTAFKPDYLRALRVTVIIVMPILFGLHYERIDEALLFMLAAFNVTLVDMGGMTYRKTARILILTTILNAFAAIVAQMAGLNIITASVITACWLAAVAMLGLLGNSGVMMSFVNSVIFVLIVVNPSNLKSVESTFIIFIAGGVWAMILSLIAWPVRPYQPIRKAIAQCFIENAIFLRALASIDKDENIQLDQGQKYIDKIHQNFRTGIDKAHEMLSNKRKGRFNKSEVEDSLISLLQSISKDHRSLIAIMVWHQQKKKTQVFSKAKDSKNLLIDLANIHEEIAKLILHSKVSEKELLTKVDKLKNEYVVAKHQKLEQFTELYRILEPVIERLKTEVLMAVWQNPSFRSKDVKITPDALITDDRTSFFTMLKNNLTFKSTCFLHALRIGITGAASVFLAKALNLPYGFWMPLTVVVIMAPDFGGSFLIRTLQRGSGTILGGLFAILVISQIHDQILIIVFLVILTFIAIGVQTINYALFVFFLTPLIVTMYSISDAGDWHIPVDRMIETISGIALALIGSQFLFPAWEKYRFPDRISGLLNATNKYFIKVLSALADENVSPLMLRSLNREMELSSSNANASLQRALTQPGLDKESITPMMTFLSMLNQLMQSVICLHEYVGVINFKIENKDKLLEAGKNISEIIQLLSDNVLLNKASQHILKDKFNDARTEMDNKLRNINAIFGSISAESLPVFELERIAEIESNMIKTLDNYLLGDTKELSQSEALFS